MQSQLNLFDIGIGALFSITFVALWLKRRHTVFPLPPGPSGIPVLGNLLQLPQENAWEIYHDWSKRFDTDILYLNAAGTPIIVLDTAEAAIDLLEKRSSIYSNRMRLVMVGELMGWNVLTGFMPYGASWRKRRHLMHDSFHPAAASKFQQYELKATHNLLRRLLTGDKSSNILQELKQMAGEIIMKVTYGIDVRQEADPYIEAADTALHTIALAAAPGAFLVDAIPALKYVPYWFPGASFQRKAMEWKKLAQYMMDLPFRDGMARIKDGDKTFSFLSNALKQRDSYEDPQEHEYIVQTATGNTYLAGSDTTVATIATAVLGLLGNPEVLKKAQKQFDEVIGGDRLPSFEDYDRLPYITAIAREALRWKPVAPLAVPHVVDADDEYKGYRFPKGSIVIPNTWAMLQNPNVYPEPFIFNPDRFIKPDGSGELDPNVRDPAHAAFGFGRRICPGRFLAFHSIWITIASLVAAFDIQKAVDEEGNEIPLTYAFQTGLVHSPEPYLCTFEIRSKRVEELVRFGQYGKVCVDSNV